MIDQIIFIVGRMVRTPAVQTTAAIATLPVTAAGMHAVGLTTDVQAETLAKGLLEGSLWITLGMAAAFGGFGGVVAELLSLHGHVEVPHRVRRGTSAKRPRLSNPRYEVDLGIFSRLVLGAAAALALLAIYAPPNASSLVVNALVAGSAATGVLRLVQGRLLAKDKPVARPRPTAPEAPTAKPQLSVVPETPPVAA
jgi:hypothetical protein